MTDNKGISLERLVKDVAQQYGFDPNKLQPHHITLDDELHPTKVYINHPDSDGPIMVEIKRPDEEWPATN
jgi:hypothetical protein